MTSFRAFDEDKEWSYLRPSLGITWLQFEDQETGSFELVVPKHWPTRVSFVQYSATDRALSGISFTRRTSPIAKTDRMQLATYLLNIQVSRMRGYLPAEATMSY